MIGCFVGGLRVVTRIVDNMRQFAFLKNPTKTVDFIFKRLSTLKNSGIICIGLMVLPKLNRCIAFLSPKLVLRVIKVGISGVERSKNETTPTPRKIPIKTAAVVNKQWTMHCFVFDYGRT